MGTLNRLQITKTEIRTYLDYILLGICLSVVVLRATITEGPTVQLASQQFTDTVYSLAISGFLILMFLIWILSRIFTGDFKYRLTGIETGIVLFIAASVVSIIFAANKRAAINDFSILFPPILMTVLLVQLIDNNFKIKLVLAVIASLGILSVYQCSEQYFFTNEMTIQEYQKDPQSVLAPRGIKEGSLQQMLFEHSLYSKDVKGFFITGNSAGSFAMMAFFAALILTVENFKNRKRDDFSNFYFLISAILTLTILGSIILTKSKGAIGALTICILFLIIYLSFSDWFGKHKKALLISFGLLSFTFTAIIILYGLRFGKLPGGNSMLVRWQYWYASVKMYLDHWLLGVGPGNFPGYYTHYKIPAAIETVSEPHNFLLNLLTQYGPLGLIGFLAICLTPLYKTIFKKTISESSKNSLPGSFIKPGIISLVLICLTFVLIRPILMPIPSSASLQEIKAAKLLFYIIPLILFASSFILFSAGPLKNITVSRSIIQAILFCAAAGVLIHNLVDFAIFEPGVFITFCTILACIISLYLKNSSSNEINIRCNATTKSVFILISIAIMFIYINFVFIPVEKTTSKIKAAMSNRSGAHKIIEQAAKDDSLNALALTIDAQLYLDAYDPDNPKTTLLTEAADSMKKAISRDSADFKNYEILSYVYALLAEESANFEKKCCLSKALHYQRQAVRRYPGNSHLRIQLAQLAEQLGKKRIALDNYKKAIEIEDAYRDQFKIMYPGKPVFKRLDHLSYDMTVEKIKTLSAPN